MNLIIKRSLHFYFMMTVLVSLISLLSMNTAWAEVVNHAKLADITLYGTGGVKLAPEFSAEKIKYRVSVNSDITNLMIRAIPMEGSDTMKINGAVVKSGADYNAKLAVGKNKI